MAAGDHGAYSKGEEDVKSKAVVATCGHVTKYSSPIPWVWAVLAVFGVCLAARQLHWGKNKSEALKNRLFFLLVGCEKESGLCRVWEEWRDPRGISHSGLEKPKLLELPKFSRFFSKTRAARTMGWQKPSPISPGNSCLGAEVCLQGAVSTKLFLNSKLWVFFH